VKKTNNQTKISCQQKIDPKRYTKQQKQQKTKKRNHKINTKNNQSKPPKK
jgi:hypothetical protein